MALREKTQIGSGEREQSRLMMQAGETGVGQRLQAGQQLAQQTTRTGEIALQGGQALGARLGEYERQKLEETRLTQQRDIAKGSEMAEGRRAELDEAVQGYERVPGGPDSPLMAEERERRVREGMDRGTAGEAPGGAQQQPGAAPGGAAPPGETPQGAGAAPALAEPSVSPRPEGQAARLQQQGMQPIELGPGGQPARPGEQQEPGSLRMSPTGERRETRADYEAQTRRMEAMNRMAVQQNTAMRAEFAGDEATYKALESEMDGNINHLSDVFTRMKNGTMTRNDFKEAKKWATDMGMQDNEADNGMLMGIIDEYAKTGETPRESDDAIRLQDFMQGYMNRRAYEYTLVLGHKPPDFIDEASPMNQAFGAASMEFTVLMQGISPVGQQAWGIQSYREKIRMQNRWAAAQVLTGKTAAPGGGAFGVPEGAPPAGGGGAAGQPGGAPPEDLRGTLEDREVQSQQKEQAFGADPGDVGSMARYVGRQMTGREEAGRPGMPTSPSGQVQGRQYEQARGRDEGGEETGPSAQRSRTERVHGEKRHAKVRELEAEGHEAEAASLANTETEVDVIGETDKGVPVLNTIPIRSNPDKWKWTEYRPGKFGWTGIARTEKRGKADPKARERQRAQRGKRPGGGTL